MIVKKFAIPSSGRLVHGENILAVWETVESLKCPGKMEMIIAVVANPSFEELYIIPQKKGKREIADLMAINQNLKLISL